MEPNHKLTVLMDGQQYGVSQTCSKHGISRTLYYRWLKRYNAEGIIGLDKVTRNFTPKNKTVPAIVATLMTLVKKNPHYGPRALKYLLDDLNYDISESAVYNILKSHKLSTKQQRIGFARKREKSVIQVSPSFSELIGGEGWLFWTTHVGNFDGLGNLYIYTFLDYQSKIACSRLYHSLSTEHFENLLTAVALPIAQMLKFEAKYLLIPQNDPLCLCGKSQQAFFSEIEKTTQQSGFDVRVHSIGDYSTDHSDDPSINHSEENLIQQIKIHYNHYCLTALLPWIKQGLNHQEIIIKFQQHIRDYNLHHKTLYNSHLNDSSDVKGYYAPFEFYAKSRNEDLILPLWAYIDRNY